MKNTPELMSAIEVDYAALHVLLEEAGAALSLAELHGGLCGVICAGGRPAGRDWLSDQLDDCAERPDRLVSGLERLEQSSWEALTEDAMEFSLLLPGDAAALERRVDALALWCHGFLSGLAIGGFGSGAEDAAGGELDEIVRDFSEISRAGAGAEESADPEDAERSLVELSEYVRVGVQLVFEELSRQHAASRQPTIH